MRWKSHFIIIYESLQTLVHNMAAALSWHACTIMYNNMIVHNYSKTFSIDFKFQGKTINEMGP